VAVSGTEGSHAAFQDICPENNEDVQRLEKLLENRELFKTSADRAEVSAGPLRYIPALSQKY